MKSSVDGWREGWREGWRLEGPKEAETAPPHGPAGGAGIQEFGQVL